MIMAQGLELKEIGMFTVDWRFRPPGLRKLIDSKIIIDRES
jgi:hypothetical protein